MSRFVVEPIILQGQRIRLEPLGIEHRDELVKLAAADPSLFRWTPNRIDGPEAAQTWSAAALADRDKGTALPFATIDHSTGRIIGSTRFMAIERQHLRVEIGGTWLARLWQRSGANREAKFLMMRHAFETWTVRRVEFKTHSENLPSRTAIARLGAIEEGTLRKHMVMADGSARDSVYFSITDDEWPAVRDALRADLDRPR